MAKFCPMCNTMTNCTDNCNACLEELESEKEKNNDELYEDLIMEQQEQM